MEDLVFASEVGSELRGVLLLTFEIRRTTQNNPWKINSGQKYFPQLVCLQEFFHRPYMMGDSKIHFSPNFLISPVFYDIQKTTFVSSCTADQQQQQQQQQEQQKQQQEQQQEQQQQQQFNVSLFFNNVCFRTSAQLKWFYYFNDACSFSLFSSMMFSGDFHRMSTAGPTAPRQGDAPLVSGGHVSDLVGHCSVSLATRWGRHEVAGIRGKWVDLRFLFN